MLDLTLAVAHHVLIFGLFGILLAEILLVRPGMDADAVRRVAAIDAWYGAAATLVIGIGFSRAIFAAKGWLYYSHNLFFWAKISTFVLIGAISIWPTVRYLRWRRPHAAPNGRDVTRVRQLLFVQVGLFPLLLVFAAAMARGYGELL